MDIPPMILDAFNQVEEAYGDKVETLYTQSVQYGPEAERVISITASSGVDINLLQVLATWNR